MADLVNKLHELKSLPEEFHWFCPRGSLEGQQPNDGDLEKQNNGSVLNAENELIRSVDKRRLTVSDALQIFAFDGADATTWQLWLKERLRIQLTSCDVCIKKYHSGKKSMKQNLEELYDEDEVARFLQVVDDLDIGRIKNGLGKAAKDLLNTPPGQRLISCLDSEGLYAIFETLSCEAFFINEDLLALHFDEPFQLIQTNKKLKMNELAPATTAFLFGSNEFRRTWASMMWSRLKTNITSGDFDTTVRDSLFNVMKKIQIPNPDLALVSCFWSGVRLILEKVDKGLITHSLRALDIDICKLALEHFQLNFGGYENLLVSVQILLTKAPSDFWDAMGAISPVTVIELILGSQAVYKMLCHSAEMPSSELSSADTCFHWLRPFIISIKAANQAPACRCLVTQLLERFQSDNFSPQIRKMCLKNGLNVLAMILHNMCHENANGRFVGSAIVAEMLDIVQQHVPKLISQVNGLKLQDEPTGLQKLGLDVIQQSFTLDCSSLLKEREILAANGHWDRSIGIRFEDTWKRVTRHANSANTALLNRFLLGCRNLVGVDFFTSKQKLSLSKDCEAFEEHLKTVCDAVCNVLDQMNDCHLDDLLAFMRKKEYSSGLIAQLFVAGSNIHQTAVELFKLMSLQTGRKESFDHLLHISYMNFLCAYSSATRRIVARKAYTPCPLILKMSGDLIEIMCEPQAGTLRTKEFSSEEAHATELLWVSNWEALTVIFETTEIWSNKGYPKEELMSFCRDTMQFAERLFDNYGIFTSAIQKALGQSNDVRRRLLDHSKATMKGMVKWLRLRDEYLSSKSVSLIGKLLLRLKDASIELPIETLSYIDGVLKGDIRAKLSDQQLAELERSFEAHIEQSNEAKEAFVRVAEKEGNPALINRSSAPLATQEKINMSSWKSKAENQKYSSSADARIESKNLLAQAIKESTPAAERFKSRVDDKKNGLKAVSSAKKTSSPAMSINSADFKRQRELEKEAKKKRDAAAVAAAKKHLPLRTPGSQIGEAGSSLSGLGVIGKDHAVKGSGMMVSSEEESEDDPEDTLDKELFGLTKGPKKGESKRQSQGEGLGFLKSKPLQPVKKQRLVRSFRDMRARLAPNLSPLHTLILSWEYFHEGDYPPTSQVDSFHKVSNTFRTPVDYQTTFEPLLTLEAWQGLVKAREEGNFKPYEIKIVSRSSVDTFVEISTTMDQTDNRDLLVSEGDVCLLAKAKNPAMASNEPHCLARVWRVSRKKSWLEVLYRAVPGNVLVSALVPGGTVYGIKVQSITPLEREYGALLGLQYYDLCEEIIRAKPSPLLKYTENQLEPIISNYKLNKAQAKAVKSALDNDAFTLVQGPPGSGKTKTIVAIVGALLTGSFMGKGTMISQPGTSGNPQLPNTTSNGPISKKLLVCAPSNAAVDELVMRFKEGIRTLGGEKKKLSIVRLGRSDAINTNVLDVTLDELVNARTGVDSAGMGNLKEETQKLMKEHQRVSDELRKARSELEKAEASKEDISKTKETFDILRRRKTQLGAQIDNARDNETITNRQNEMNRKRAQQAIIDEANVICATLSGSGHEMFQSLSVEFETVVVDEAAQCVEMSALIPLKYGCAKCILVGDPKQLPPTVFSKEAARFQYEQSLFVRMQANHPDDVHLLDMQYRMHPQISQFPSKIFYDGRLLDGKDMAEMRRKPWHKEALLSPYCFFDVQGQHQAAPRGHSLVNVAEIMVALKLFETLTSRFSDYDFKGKVGIITPYKSQLREMKQRFLSRYGDQILKNVEFNTTDAFQGRESEVIIFSCVRASPAGGIGFLQDVRRMNVGLTRAKSSLWVLGNSESLARGEYWQKLIVDSQTRGCYVQGDITSMLQRGAGTGATTAPGRVQLSANGFSKNRLRPETGKPHDISTSVKYVEETFAGTKDASNKDPARVVKPANAQDDNKTKLLMMNKKRKTSYSGDEDVVMSDIAYDVIAQRPSCEPNATVTIPREERPKPKTEQSKGSLTTGNIAKQAPFPSSRIDDMKNEKRNETIRPRIPPPKRKKAVSALIQPSRPRKPK